MTNRVFIIADTHFGHKRIVELQAAWRPFATIEEHDAELVRRWNDRVRKQDIVWHLGDVLLGQQAFATLARLNGIKKLVLGNHDSYPCARYLQYFSQVYGCAQMRDCIFTHIPVHASQFSRYKANIHGHSHHRTMDDPRYLCVSAEQTELTPILLDTLMQRVPHGD